MARPVSGERSLDPKPFLILRTHHSLPFDTRDKSAYIDLIETKEIEMNNAPRPGLIRNFIADALGVCCLIGIFAAGWFVIALANADTMRLPV